MQKSIYYLLIFLAFFFSGCLVQDEPVAPTPVPTTVEIQSTSTDTVTPIPSATNTVQPPTITSTDETGDTPKPTQTALGVTETVNKMYSQCLVISDTLPINQYPEGNLVLKSKGNLDAYLWNMKTETKISFHRDSGDRLLAFDVSPDRTKIVYLRENESGSQMTIIAGADGQNIWSDNVAWYSWFNNDYLQTAVNYSTGWFSYRVLLNPFSGEKLILHPDFPDAYLRDPKYPKWDVMGRVAYDPTLTRAAYPECNKDCTERWNHGELGWTVAMTDLETGKIITRLITMDSFGTTPEWTLNGEQFIFATKLDPNDPYPPADSFYSVTRDGQVKQLAYFPDDVILDSYSIAPNGRLVAFWLAEKQDWDDDAHLMVLDSVTGDLTDYCIITATPYYTVRPIWSPDNSQILLNLALPEDETNRYAVLVDFRYGWAAKIVEYMEPVGWMINP